MTTISDRLFTNYVPSIREASEVRGIILNLDTRRRALEDDMTRIQGKIGDILARSNELVTVSGTTFQLAGFDGLPVDVVEHIFLHCLPSEHYPVLSTDEPPLLLTRVSKVWKQIALETPYLWSSLHLPTLVSPTVGHHNLSYETASRGLITSVRNWLDRSGTLPLCISFAAFGTNHAENDVLFSEIMRHSSRLRKLAITSSLHLLASRISESLPSLESLCISQIDGPLHSPTTWNGNVFLMAPQLRELELKVSEDVSNLPVAWTNLTHLSLRGDGRNSAWSAFLTVKKVAAVLHSCYNLISCTVEIYPDIIGGHDNQVLEAMRLPRLDRLIIREHTVDLVRFLAAFDIPALRHFGLYSVPSILSSLISIRPFIQRIGLQIQTFCSDFINFSEDDFLHILCSCPQLTGLGVKSLDTMAERVGPEGSTDLMTNSLIRRSSFHMDDSFLSILTSRNTDGSYLASKLADLELLEGVKFSDRAFLDFIKAKQMTGDPLTSLNSISVRFSRKQVLPIAAELKQFEQAGLRLKVWYPLIDVTSPFDAFHGIEDRVVDWRVELSS